jgi:hypothetical protein
MRIFKAKGALKLTNRSNSRIVVATDFNVSRGWRNFIKDNPVPPFTSEHLKVQY